MYDVNIFFHKTDKSPFLFFLFPLCWFELLMNLLENNLRKRMQTRKKTLCFLLWLPFGVLFTLRCDFFECYERLCVLWDCLELLLWQFLLFLHFCTMFEIRLYWSISQTSQQWRSWEAAEKLSDHRIRNSEMDKQLKNENRGWCGILPQVSLHDCMFISAFSLVDLPRKALDSTAQTQEMQKCEDIFRSLNRCFAAACFIFLLV